MPERVKIMKIIFDNCTQTRRYGPSTGKCLIQLESGDNAKEIIKEYTKTREWYERTYSNPQRFSEYTYKVHKKNENGQWERVDEIVKGDLILFDTYQEYLD